MLDIERRKIISDLNYLFDDFSYLLELAKYCDNNYEIMIKMISKIIKYSFCYDVSNDFGYLKSPDKIDEDYKKYLINNKKRFDLFRKNINIHFSYALDSDIRLTDLLGLKLPSISKLMDACRVNKQNLKEKKEREERQTAKCRDAMHFEETAFWYATTDLVVFDENFKYYHSNLSGKLEMDFYNLYHDERYLNNPNSPLNNPFFENLDKILKVNDIDITRIGDLYLIGNGRHRILYLMYFDCEYPIPVSVTKRIEDREFNIILLRLKEKYKISIIKNNIFNEEPNILINYNSKTYNVKNKEELILFEKKLDNSESLDEFYVAEYNVIYKNTDNKLFSYIRDKMIIFWLNHKSLNIFEGNYTDYLKISGEVNSNILLEAFCVNQKIYQKYKYLGLDFEECVLYRLIDSTDEKDKVIRRLYEEAEREEEKRKVYEKKA